MGEMCFMRDNRGRTDFYALRSNWGDDVEWGMGDSIPDGFFKMNIVGVREGSNAYHFTFADGEFTREYVTVEDGDTRISPARTYRVGDLFWWVYTKGKSEELDALLKARGLYTAAVAQTTVSDGDPNFTTILDSIASELGFTEEDIAEALKSAVV